jgi:PhnB protein
VTTLAPWLSVSDTAAALAFYKAAFGAVDIDRFTDDSGVVQVAELWVGGANFWIQFEPIAAPESRESESIRMILSVDDPDAVFATAINAGAVEIGPVAEGNGWRVGRIADPWGHHWEVGRRLK